MLKQRIITGIVIVLALFTALFVLPPIGFFVVMLIIGILGSIEWAKMSKSVGAIGLYVFPAVMVVVAAVLEYYFEFNLLYNVAGVLIWLILAASLAGTVKDGEKSWITLVKVVVVIPLAVFSVYDLLAKHPDGAYWLATMFILVGIADCAAYFAGRRFGKTKLAARISPGKTREGLFGGLLAVWGLALAGGAVVWEGDYSKMLVFAGVCLLCALFSVVGDLYISLQKRIHHVKDSGSILPGHGGILDRIDSTLAVAPVYALCVKLVLN